MSDLDSLRELAEAASHGPSRVEPMRGDTTFFGGARHFSVFRHSPDDEDRRVGEIVFTTSGPRAHDEAVRIAIILDAFPALIDRVERAESALSVERIAEALRATFPAPESYEEWQEAVDRSYEGDAAALRAALLEDEEKK